MICCKIVTDFNNVNGKFGQLLTKLGKYGDVLWESGSMFFANTEDEEFDEKKLERILKQSGYKKFFLNIYSKDNEPRENDNINGWLYDRIMKINYISCERESQKIFKDISHGLDLLDEMLEEELTKIRQEKNNTKEDDGA